MENANRQPIGVELVKRGIVKEVDIQKALEYQKTHHDKKIGDILHELGLAESDRLIKAIGDVMGAKGIIITNRDINLKLVNYISTEIAKTYKALPIEVDDGVARVVFSNSTDQEGYDKVKEILANKGLVLDAYITFDRDLRQILNNLDGTNMNSMKEETTSNITDLVDQIIRTGIEKRASDIHIEPMAEFMRVRYRIDGELITAAKLPKSRQSQIIGRLKAISNMHQEKQEAQDGRILTYENYSIRVSAQPNIYGEKFVLRLLKKNQNIRSAFELGYPGTEEDLLKTINKRNSIVVIAAPTGEGKTTTLYSMMSYLNKPEINITTIEDPVEIRIEGLNQIEIDGAKTTFDNSLRTVLRQDPDIILVGEIRDQQTGETAIQAGQTGHYVLTTIHTIDSVETITRLRKMGIADYDIASTLSTSISQRLVRRICPECRKERPFTEEEKQIIAKIGEKYGVNFDTSGNTFEAVGCPHCNGTGYYERVGIFEILHITEDIKELILKGASSIEIRRKALENGFQPLVLDGLNKVVQGYTTLEELNKKLVIY